MGLNPRTSQHIANLIDDLLAAEKTLAGTPYWRDGNRPDERRLDWPVLVEGQSVNCLISVTAYPNIGEERFTITLNYGGRCIWRVDYEPNYAHHINPPERAVTLGGYDIPGPHYHSWGDNRHHATPVSLPKELDCARELPSNARGWDNVFRWFCGEINVNQPDEIPDLPRRTRLL